MAARSEVRDSTALKTIFVGSRPTAKQLRKSRLVVLQGPDAGRELDVLHEQVTVGRSSVCDLTLTDSSVSSRHFSIIASGHGYLLRDIGSTNGTYYGEVRIREIWLRPGTVFRAGKTVLKFEPSHDVVTIELSSHDRFGELSGASIIMREVFAQLERIAPSDLTVLLQGQTGTGKEMAARALHENSPRRDKPFVVLDCSAIPQNLIESTLFGHEKGSFTGAIAQYQGIFEQADGGTIFLDEIGELDLNLQPKLLRVLESRQFKRVGSDRTLNVDVRVIAATNRDLQAMVAQGAFREDLYFRLGVVQVQLPTLNQRPEDIPLLVQAFLERANQQRVREGKVALQLGEDALRALQARPWPGNVRELKNVVERASSLTDGPVLSRDDLLVGQAKLRSVLTAPEVSAEGAAQPSAGEGAQLQPQLGLSFKEAKKQLLDGFERQYLEALMAQHGGNLSQAARTAELTRYHLRELLKKHALHLPER